MGLRNIIIDLGEEFGLKKQQVVNGITIEISGERQFIRVDFEYQWLKPSGEIFRSEKNSFTLLENDDITDENGNVIPGRKYLSEWDAAVGDTIEQGIISYLTT